MSKARKAALDWLPKRKDGRKRCYQCDDDDLRGIYAKGYRKAEIVELLKRVSIE